MARSAPEASASVLLISADQGLIDRVAGLVTAAGLRLDRAATLDAGSAADCRVVLVGADVAAGGRPRPAAGSSAQAPKVNVGPVVVVEGEVAPEVWQGALRIGAQQVAVLPQAEPWLIELLLDAASGGPRARLVAVLGGRGGAGASTLATALAVTTASGGSTSVLVDLDALGGGLDLLLGAEHEPGLRWEDLAGARGRLQPGLLSSGLPVARGVRLLTWARREDPVPVTEAVGSVLDSAVRESDLVVLDLARRLDEGARAALARADHVLLVVPAEVRATAAAGQVLSAVERLAGDVRLIVRGPAPTGLSADAVADALALPLAGELRAEPGIAADLDRGLAPPIRPRGPLAVLCRRLAADLRAA